MMCPSMLATTDSQTSSTVGVRITAPVSLLHRLLLMPVAASSSSRSPSRSACVRSSSVPSFCHSQQCCNFAVSVGWSQSSKMQPAIVMAARAIRCSSLIVLPFMAQEDAPRWRGLSVTQTRFIAAAISNVFSLSHSFRISLASRRPPRRSLMRCVAMACPSASISTSVFSIRSTVQMLLLIAIAFHGSKFVCVSVMPRVCSWYRQNADGSTLRFPFFVKLPNIHPSAPHRLQTRTPFNACHLWLPPHRVVQP